MSEQAPTTVIDDANKAHEMANTQENFIRAQDYAKKLGEITGIEDRYFNGDPDHKADRAGEIYDWEKAGYMEHATRPIKSKLVGLEGKFETDPRNGEQAEIQGHLSGVIRESYAKSLSEVEPGAKLDDILKIAYGLDKDSQLESYYGEKFGISKGVAESLTETLMAVNGVVNENLDPMNDRKPAKIGRAQGPKSIDGISYLGGKDFLKGDEESDRAFDLITSTLGIAEKIGSTNPSDDKTTEVKDKNGSVIGHWRATETHVSTNIPGVEAVVSRYENDYGEPEGSSIGFNFKRPEQ